MALSVLGLVASSSSAQPETMREIAASTPSTPWGESCLGAVGFGVGAIRGFVLCLDQSVMSRRSKISEVTV